jgi:hypothetical protein
MKKFDLTSIFLNATAFLLFIIITLVLIIAIKYLVLFLFYGCIY